MFNSSSGQSHEHTEEFGSFYFGLKNQYKIVLNIVKKIFFIVCDANKNIKKLKPLYYIFL